MRMAWHHHRNDDVLHVAELDHPGKETNHPAAFVVGRVVELQAAIQRANVKADSYVYLQLI
eukprot:3194083-Pleurochrysis_carterae.AAC.1